MSARRACFGALLLTLLVAGLPTAAQPPHPQPPKADKNELARQLVDQLYTPKGVLPIKDLVVDLDDCEAQEDAPSNLVKRAATKIFYKFPAKIRVDQLHSSPNSGLDGKMTYIIRDGDHMWIYASIGQFPVKKGIDTGQPTLALPFNIQKYRKDAEREYYYLGPETIDGTPVHRVQILNPAIPNWCVVLWIDGERRVPIQMDAAIPGDTEKDKVKSKRILYQDIRKLDDGRYMPFQIQIFENDILKQVKLYKGIKVNVGLEESLFQPMKEFYKQK